MALSKLHCSKQRCSREFETRRALENHMLQHGRFRCDVPVYTMLQLLMLPGPARVHIIECIGEESLLSKLRLRVEDYRITDMYWQKAALLIEGLSIPPTRERITQIRRIVARWTREECLATRWCIIRAANKVITACNGNRHPKSSTHRHIVQEDLSLALLETFELDWRWA